MKELGSEQKKMEGHQPEDSEKGGEMVEISPVETQPRNLRAR